MGARGEGSCDRRARGNAPQLLEKYKKLAHDASLNGDRVQTEYYLQFADHYFRVIADNKAQKDEQQQSQRARHHDRDEYDEGDEDEDRQQQRGQRGRRGRDERDDRNDGDEDGRRGSEGESVSNDEDENPFVRESKPRRGRSRANGAGSEAGGLDPPTLPPSKGSDDDKDEAVERPRRRARSSRSAASEEAREAHG